VRTIGLWGLLCLACAANARAQDLEPRAYAASPTGANFVVIAFTRATGDVLFDPTVPVTDVHATLNATAVGVGRTFGLGGRLALFTAALPYSWGDVTGKVNEQSGSITRSGLADLRAKLSVNLFGNPAAAPAQFVRAPRRTVIGASLTVAAPSGQYDPHKLINLGTNRWAFKPEVGVSRPAGRWVMDGYAGVWFFTENGAFYPGERRRQQDPIVALQGHVSYTFRPRTWVAFDGTWYAGGAPIIDGGAPGQSQNNVRLGAVLALPVTRGQSVKIGYSSGATTRTGTDFRNFTVAWQLLWLDRHRARPPAP
jgi:hypothetical protein